MAYSHILFYSRRTDRDWSADQAVAHSPAECPVRSRIIVTIHMDFHARITSQPDSAYNGSITRQDLHNKVIFYVECFQLEQSKSDSESYLDLSV